MQWLVWTPWGIPALLVLAVCGTMAAFIFWARPDATQNRRLALQLFIEAFVVASLAGLTWFIRDPRASVALTLTMYAFVWPKLWTYYNFLATLPTPLARLVRPQGRRFAFLAVTLACSATVFIWPEAYVGGTVAHPDGGTTVLAGTMFLPMMQAWGVMWLVGLSFSISALRHAKTATSRQQARAYLIAFGMRDVAFFAVTVALSVVPPTSPTFLWWFMAFPATWILYPLLVGYGILRHQLFGIDVKIRFAVRHTALATLAATVFVVASELLENAVEARLGQGIGLAAALLITYASRPIRGMADAVAHRVSPASGDDEPTRIYRAALEGALEDGDISDREHAVLGRLAEQLGIDSNRHEQLVRDVRTIVA